MPITAGCRTSFPLMHVTSHAYYRSLLGLGHALYHCRMNYIIFTHSQMHDIASHAYYKSLLGTHVPFPDTCHFPCPPQATIGLRPCPPSLSDALHHSQMHGVRPLSASDHTHLHPRCDVTFHVCRLIKQCPLSLPDV